MRKVVIIGILLLLVFFGTEWVVKFIQNLIFRTDQYMAVSRPLIRLTKYFAMAGLIFFFLYRYATLTPQGKKILPLLLAISIGGVLVSSLWINGAGEENISRFRVVWGNKASWEEVEFVSTEIYHSKRRRPPRTNQYRERNVIAKYNIHLKDGTVINVWDDVDSVYQLHQLVVSKNIPIDHLSNTEEFEQNFAYYFGSAFEKAREIFGAQ